MEASVMVDKVWWKSRTVWSGIITVAASVGALFGVAIPQDLALGAVMAIVTGLSGAGTIVGRIAATQPIETKKRQAAKRSDALSSSPRPGRRASHDQNVNSDLFEDFGGK